MSVDDPTPQELERAFAALGDRAESRDGCPAPERIWEAVRGELPAGEAEAIVDHTSSCGACAEAWRIAVEIARNAPVAAPRAWIRRPRAWLGVGVAAMLALSIGGAYLWRDRNRGAAPAFRQADGAVIRSLVAETTPLPRDGLVLRWSPGPDGTRYRVRVSREDLSLVAVAQNLERTEYQVPTAALQSIAPNTRLLWQVDASLPGGVRTTSPTFMVVVQ
jgi:hypothetical protein